MNNLDILMILTFLLVMGNLWFMVAFLRFSRSVEARLREAIARKR